MNKKEYNKMKATYLKHKQWCMDNLDTYLADKEKIKINTLSELEKENTLARISIYEIYAQLVKEAEDAGLHLVTRTDN